MTVVSWIYEMFSFRKRAFFGFVKALLSKDSVFRLSSAMMLTEIIIYFPFEFLWTLWGKTLTFKFTKGNGQQFLFGKKGKIISPGTFSTRGIVDSLREEFWLCLRMLWSICCSLRSVFNEFPTCACVSMHAGVSVMCYLWADCASVFVRKVS